MVALTLTPARFGDAIRCHYQEQDSLQTLAEGLAEYYSQNSGRVLPAGALPPESAQLFRSHDICHVIFGLDTTLADEAMADIRTLLSCDVGWRHYTNYLSSDPQVRAIFKQVGYATVLWATVRAIPRLLRAVMEAWRMPRRWPWRPPDEYFGRSLRALREQFRIRVI